MKKRELLSWIPLKEFAGLCGVHYQTALRWVSSGRVNARKSNGKWEVSKASYDEYVNNESKWITIDEAAKVAGKSAATIRTWMDDDDDMASCIGMRRVANVKKRQILIDRNLFSVYLSKRQEGKVDGMRALVDSLAPLGGYGRPSGEATGNGGGGNSRVYLIRRLKRDAPEFAEGLASGLFGSVRAAVEAARKAGKFTGKKR